VSGYRTERIKDRERKVSGQERMRREGPVGKDYRTISPQQNLLHRHQDAS
jgi:hypothetical protein